MKKGWSRAELARELASVGCGLTEADLYNVEGPGPSRRPRSVRVDELASLSEVFGLPIPELLAPPEVRLVEEVVALVRLMGEHQRSLRQSYQGLRRCAEDLAEYVQPSARADLVEACEAVEAAVVGLLMVGVAIEDELRGGAPVD